MPSLMQLCAPALSSLHVLALLFSLNIVVQGATLRESYLRGTEGFHLNSQAPPRPSAAMLQSLQYIQSLGQLTLHDPVPRNDKPMISDNDQDDMERVLTMLQLATSASMPTRTYGGGEELDERDEEKDKQEDKVQQWIQTVLNTLQQTEDHLAPLNTPQKLNTNSLTPTHPLFMLSPFSKPKQHQVGQMSVKDYKRNLQAIQGIHRRHRKFPLMFEEQDKQDQLLKRTNENAEEQYTPQKLATLQSVFEEISEIANSKIGDDESDNSNEYNGGHRQKKIMFTDLGEEFMPLEEKTEEEVEEDTQRHEFNGDLGDDGKEQDEVDLDAEEYKRSDPSDLVEVEKVEDQDDIRRLVDDYLIPFLEQTEQRQQNKDQEEKKEQQEQVWHHTSASSKTPSLSYTNSYNIHKNPTTLLYQWPQTAETNSMTQDILSVLGLINTAQPNVKSLLRRPNLYKSAPAKNKYLLERELPYYTFYKNNQDQLKDDYDDTVSEDELTSYLTGEMLAQRQRHSPLLIKVAQNDLDKPVAERNQVENGNTEEDTLLNIFKYMNLESEDKY